MAKSYRRGPGSRLVNTALQQMAQRGMGAPYLHVLTVKGRKSGRPHSTPVDVMELSGERWLVAPYGATNWVHNVRSAGEATLSRAGHSAVYKVVPATVEEALPVIRKYMTDVPITRAYWDARPDASDQAIRAEFQTHPVFRLVPVS